MHTVAGTSDPKGHVAPLYKTVAVQDEDWESLSVIRDGSLGSLHWFILGCSALLVISCAIAFATGSWVYIIWAGASCSLANALRWLLLNIRRETSRRDYHRVVALSAINTSLFAAMPVFLWLSTDILALKAIAFCGITCGVMYKIASHRAWTRATLFDVATLTVVVLIIGVFETIQATSLANKTIVIAGCAMFLIYALVAQYKIIADRKTAHQSWNAQLEAQRVAAIGNVTGGIAHEFNNLLTALQGNIELAELTHDPNQRRDHLREARQAAERGGVLVAQMMAYVGKSPHHISDVALRDYIPGLRRRLSALCPPQIQLDLYLMEEALQVRTDQSLLETALEHLVTNAHQATGSRTGTVQMRIFRAPGPTLQMAGLALDKPMVQFELRDRGPGVSNEVLGRLTEPFYSTKAPGEGSGLGLSMVKGFAHQMGGALLLRNHPDGGFEASLLLPAVPLPHKASAASEPKSSAQKRSGR